MSESLLRVDIDRDMNEIVKLISKYMQKTYVKEIEREMLECAKRCGHEESKEVQLLRAMVPFIPEDKKSGIEKVVQMMTYEQIIRKTLPKVVPGALNRSDSKKTDDIGKELIATFILYKILTDLNPL